LNEIQEKLTQGKRTTTVFLKRIVA